MAAYAATVSSAMRRASKIDDVVGVYLYAGQVDITNYNSTLVEITGITGKFRSMVSVVGGVSESGYIVEWVPASKSFKAYYFDYNAAGDGAAIEAADDTDVGVVSFIAVGLN